MENNEIVGEQTPQTNTPAESTAQKNEVVEYVTKKDLAQIVNNSIQAALRRSGSDKTTTKAVTDESSETLSLKSQVELLQQERRLDREKIAKKEKDVAVKSAINSFGLDSDNAEIFELLVEKHYGKNIKYENDKVIYHDEFTGDRKEVKDVISELWESKKDRFKPAVQTIQSRGLKPSNASKETSILPNDLAKLSEQDFKAAFKKAINNLS